MKTQPSLLVLALAASACMTENALMALSGPDDGAAASTADTDGSGSASGEASGAGDSHATLGSTTSTVTTATDGVTSGDLGSDASTDTDVTGTTDPGSTTSIDPPPPPAILGRDLAPVPIDENGPIFVTVSTEYAEGVRMLLDDGAEIELSATADPDLFVGEIAALTGFDNGEHTVIFEPWRGEIVGEPADAVYVLDLPTPGAGLYWETGDLIGSGRVASLGISPTGEVTELGMILDPQNIPRCYVRQRTKDGTWGPDDFIPLLPSSECEPIDLEIGDDGEIFVLARWKLNNNSYRWWLGKIPEFGAPTQTIGMGTWGEEAYALAHYEGSLAVCGSFVTSEGDLDAIARIYRDGEEDQDALGLFDYHSPAINEEHWFDETARDCLFVAQDHLVLVGAARGAHIKDDPVRERRFILSYDIGSGVKPDFLVAGPGPGKATQSAARGIARDEEGRIYIAGRTCEDQCLAEGWLWVHDAEGKVLTDTSLGLFSNDIFVPRAVRWSNAGYAVLASGGALGKETEFTLRAYSPDQLEPVWSFAGPGNQLLNVALAVAIGPYAEVCAGGFGANLYPAFACFGS